MTSGPWWQDEWHVNCVVYVEGLRLTGLMLTTAITTVVLICNYCVTYSAEGKNYCLEIMIVLQVSQRTLNHCLSLS